MKMRMWKALWIASIILFVLSVIASTPFYDLMHWIVFGAFWAAGWICLMLEWITWKQYSYRQDKQIAKMRSLANEKDELLKTVSDVDRRLRIEKEYRDKILVLAKEMEDF